MGSSTIERISCEQLDLFPTCKVIDFARAAAAIRRRRQSDAEAVDTFDAYVAALEGISA